MSTASLVHRSLLDPREPDEAAACPIADAVNIPFAELPERMHELPPRGRLLRVAAPEPLAAQVVDWLTKTGRRAEVADDFRHEHSQSSNDIGRLWEPNAFLTQVLLQLSGGTALDLACGSGRDAVFMASRGWRVTAADVLPDALDRARDLARRCAAAVTPIRWVEADLESEQLAFDARFDLIVVVRYLHRPLISRLAGWLRTGGSIVCETFTALHRARHGKPARDAHVLAPGELPRLLAGVALRHYSEDWRGDAHTARAWVTRH